MERTNDPAKELISQVARLGWVYHYLAERRWERSKCPAYTDFPTPVQIMTGFYI